MSHPAPTPTAQDSRLAVFLREHHIGQRELAMEMGVTRQQIGAWCRGRRTPRPVSRRQIAAAVSNLLGREVSPSVIFGDGTHDRGRHTPMEVQA